MSKKRRNYNPAFKAKVALAVIKGEAILSESGVNANLITKWKKQLLENSDSVFATSKTGMPDKKGEIKELHAKMGEITMVNGFLSKALNH